MRRWGTGQFVVTLVVCVAIWAAVAYGCLYVGSTGVHWPSPEIFPRRFASVMMASVVGAALGAAGATYQAVFRNALADPYLLGVSSGANLTVYLWRSSFDVFTGAAALLAVLGSLSQQVFAFAGAAASVGIVFLLAQRRGRLEPVTMILVGVVVNAVNGAFFLLVHFVINRYVAAGQSGDPLKLLVGSFDTNLTPTQRWTAAACVLVGIVILLSISGSLAVAWLGEDEVESLGVRVQRLRWIGLVTASLVTASAVAVAGPIGFVGLICPHLARMLVGTDFRRLFPVAIATAAAMLAAADAGARRLDQLPVGVLTGLLGGPFFLLLLWRLRRAPIV